jgi:hypothetical protein
VDKVVYCDHYNGKCLLIRTGSDYTKQSTCDASNGSPGTCLGFSCCYSCENVKDCLEKKTICNHLKWDIERRGNLLKLMVIGKKITVKPLFDMFNDKNESTK